MSYAEHRYRSRDGLSLYYREYGAGDEAVLCLHGLTRNSKDFHALASHLSGRYRVLVPDVRGRGRSERDPRRSNYSAAVYVRDVWQLLDERHVDRLTVIGTSMGGLIGMTMADQQPDRLRGLVMNDIGPEVPSPALARIMAYAGKRPPARDWDEAAQATRRAYELALPGMPAEFWREYVRLGWRENDTGRPEPDVDRAVGDVLRNPPRAVRVLRWLHRHKLVRRVAGVALDPWDSFRAMTAPCLLIHGAISDVLTADIIRRMRDIKPDLEVIDVPERGHTPMLDEPGVRDTIDAFLARIHDD